MQAFEQGFRAYVAGAGRDANPFDVHTDDERRWSRGWRTAELVQAKQMAEDDIEAGLDSVLGADRAMDGEPSA
ncbi:hypothetical protein [Niveibacterium sp. SC-1]|uniref:ribosome modulation factor n=1 Tax=Niveibacterium sp. SC-1 TaxID=3135646 RepID=UPI00311F3F53